MPTKRRTAEQMIHKLPVAEVGNFQIQVREAVLSIMMQNIGPETVFQRGACRVPVQS